MKRRRTAAHARLARQLTELAVAAPQVVLHRTTGMARAGLAPSAADMAEMARMSNEKVLAFYQSWGRMSLAAFGSYASFFGSAGAASTAAARVLSAGLVPVHAKAVANARRLGKART
jgi:hypothetical protein